MPKETELKIGDTVIGIVDDGDEEDPFLRKGKIKKIKYCDCGAPKCDTIIIYLDDKEESIFDESQLTKYSRRKWIKVKYLTRSIHHHQKREESLRRTLHKEFPRY
jgi:hypothetical protein